MKNNTEKNIISIPMSMRLNKLHHYDYSFSFSSERKLTQDEIMKVSKVGADVMRKVILEQTKIDTKDHNSSSGIENR